MKYNWVSCLLGIAAMFLSLELSSSRTIRERSENFAVATNSEDENFYLIPIGKEYDVILDTETGSYYPKKDSPQDGKRWNKRQASESPSGNRSTADPVTAASSNINSKDPASGAIADTTKEQSPKTESPLSAMDRNETMTSVVDSTGKSSQTSASSSTDGTPKVNISSTASAFNDTSEETKPSGSLADATTGRVTTVAHSDAPHTAKNESTPKNPTTISFRNGTTPETESFNRTSHSFSGLSNVSSVLISSTTSKEDPDPSDVSFGPADEEPDETRGPDETPESDETPGPDETPESIEAPKPDETPAPSGSTVLGSSNVILVTFVSLSLISSFSKLL